MARGGGSDLVRDLFEAIRPISLPDWFAPSAVTRDKSLRLAPSSSATLLNPSSGSNNLGADSVEEEEADDDLGDGFFRPAHKSRLRVLAPEVARVVAEAHDSGQAAWFREELAGALDLASIARDEDQELNRSFAKRAEAESLPLKSALESLDVCDREARFESERLLKRKEASEKYVQQLRDVEVLTGLVEDKLALTTLASRVREAARAHRIVEASRGLTELSALLSKREEDSDETSSKLLHRRLTRWIHATRERLSLKAQRDVDDWIDARAHQPYDVVSALSSMSIIEAYVSTDVTKDHKARLDYTTKRLMFLDQSLLGLNHAAQAGTRLQEKLQSSIVAIRRARVFFDIETKVNVFEEAELMDLYRRVETAVATFLKGLDWSQGDAPSVVELMEAVAAYAHVAHSEGSILLRSPRLVEFLSLQVDQVGESLERWFRASLLDGAEGYRPMEAIETCGALGVRALKVMDEEEVPRNLLPHTRGSASFLSSASTFRSEPSMRDCFLEIYRDDLRDRLRRREPPRPGDEADATQRRDAASRVWRETHASGEREFLSSVRKEALDIMETASSDLVEILVAPTLRAAAEEQSLDLEERLSAVSEQAWREASRPRAVISKVLSSFGVFLEEVFPSSEGQNDPARADASAAKNALVAGGAARLARLEADALRRSARVDALQLRRAAADVTAIRAFVASKKSSKPAAAEEDPAEELMVLDKALRPFWVPGELEKASERLSRPAIDLLKELLGKFVELPPSSRIMSAMIAKSSSFSGSASAGVLDLRAGVVRKCLEELARA